MSLNAFNLWNFIRFLNEKQHSLSFHIQSLFKAFNKPLPMYLQ